MRDKHLARLTELHEELTELRRALFDAKAKENEERASVIGEAIAKGWTSAAQITHILARETYIEHVTTIDLASQLDCLLDERDLLRFLIEHGDE